MKSLPESKQIEKQPSLKESGKKAKIPEVHSVFGPAELIETKGDPQYNLIPGTGLEYVTNTSGYIFRLNGEYYVLLAGRWFKGATLNGLWAFPDWARRIGSCAPGVRRSQFVSCVRAISRAKCLELCINPYAAKFNLPRSTGF